MTDASVENNGLINNGDGITLTYILSVLETSYFSTAYALQNTLTEKKLYRKNYGTAAVQCLLDYLHVIPFLVHHFNYGEVSLSWAKFSRWIQLQLPIWTYTPFAIAFWVTVVVVAILLGLCVYVGVSHWNRLPGSKLVKSTAAFSLTTGFQVFFPAAFYLLALPWFCDWRTKTLFAIDEHPACFTGANLISIIIGTMSVLCLLGLASFSAFIKSSVEPVDNDMTITSGVLFKTQYYFTIAFMTINRFWIAPTIGSDSFGNWWEALFNLLALTLLFGSLVYYLPYQVQESNQFRGAILMSLWWISCVSFMSINILPNPDQIDRQLDYILIAGLLPFLLLGEYIVKSRYAHLNTFATALIEEVKVAAENKKRAAAKAAELGVVAQKSGPRPPAAKKDAKDDGKGKDAKGKDAKGKDAKGAKGKEAAKDGKAAPGKEGAKDDVAAAQKAALLALDQKLENDEKRRNTRLYLPRILQDYQSGITTIDIVSRLLWHFNDDKNSLEAAGLLLDAAEKAYPEVPYVKVLRVSYCTALAADPSVHLPKLDIIKKMEPGVLSRYYVYKRAVDIRDRAKVSSSTGGENSLDLVAYIEFQNLFRETKKYNNRAIESIREFWMLFLQKSITATAFNRAAREIDLHAQRAVLVYKTMLTKFPKNPQVLTSYAYFLDLVLRNTDEAQRCIRRADEQKAREAEEARNGNVAGQIDSQAVVAITEDASIDQVNKALLEMFGYTRNEVLGRNIKLLVPSPWKEKHDGILSRYRATGIAKVIGITQTLYGHHKEGYAFSMRLLVQERRKENGERNFIGMIQSTNLDTKIGLIIINEVGIIKMVTKITLDLFGGYRAGEIVGKNIVVLMIDSFAAGHDNYLKRYRETGDARVIGTAGRNVPAKRKDGSTFPAALTVEELYADGERYYLGRVQDTSNVQGVLFMDGFGTIQNSDAGIQQLLGYSKEMILGKNIKGIMPPPYCDYHDMYLERYRRTKVSNILRSIEGRILPALHADGSQVQIRAIVQRADSGDSGQNMLFKGTIKRGNLTGSGGAGSRKGYMGDYEVELNRAGVITKINRKILTMLGHPSDRQISDFIGQPIEVLIPALPDRPFQQKSNWFTRALKSPDLNFYLIAVNKNFTLLPITYCLEESRDGAIRMRIRDVSELDALINIDEVGNVLSMNDDAFMLLGFEPDETIGRNIKYIQPPEVSEQHDYYLQRYKDTGVARVVGIARTVDAMHRDGSVFSCEIQVTEQISSDGNKIFIGRLRHRKIEERCEKDLISRYIVNTKNLASAISSMSADQSAAQSAVSMTSDGTKRINFKGKKGSSKGSRAVTGSVHSGPASIHDDADEHSVLSNSLNGSSHSAGSHGTSSVSSNTKFLALLSKLKTIKNSSKEDPSTSRLGTVLNLVLAGYAIFFIIGLIVTNTLQTAVPYYELLNVLLDTDVVINEVILGARVLELELDPHIIISFCAWNPEYASDAVEGAHGAATGGAAPAADPHAPAADPHAPAADPHAPAAVHRKRAEEIVKKPLCPWLKAGLEAHHYRSTLTEEQKLKDIRNVAQWPIAELLPEYTHELKEVSHRFKEHYASIRKPGDTFDQIIQGLFVMNQFINGTASIASPVQLSTFWNVLGTLSDATATLAQNEDMGPNSIRSWNLIINNRYTITGFVSAISALIPGQATSAINSNMIFHFIMALVSIAIGVAVFLLLLLPRIREIQIDRERILRLLLLMPKSNVYDLVHRVYTTANDEDDDDNKKDEEEEEEEEESEQEGGEGEAQEITVIADRSVGIYLIFILGLAALTIPLIAHAIYRYIDDQKNLISVSLINDLTILYLKVLALSWQTFAGYFHCEDPTFCAQPLTKGVNNFLISVDQLETAYNDAVVRMQGSPEVIKVFTLPQCFSSPNGLQRCVDEEPMEGFLPPNFFSKTHNGYSNLIQNLIRSCRRYGADVLAADKAGDVSKATATAEDFWYIYEIPLMEGEAGINTAFRVAKDELETSLKAGIVAANISYAVALGASFVIFFWVFGSVRRSIQVETKYNRGVLYMVPHDVLRSSKAMIEYIENLHVGLGA